MSWRKLSRTGWLLLLNGATLLLIVAALWLRLRPESPPAAAAPGGGERTIAVRHPSVADLAQAPLFSPSRQPQPEPKADGQPAQAALAVGDAPVLIGVVGDNGAFRALLEDRAGANRELLRRGATFAGWTLLAVDRKTAQLGAGERRVVLDLSETRPGSGLPAGAPATGTAPNSTPTGAQNGAQNSAPAPLPNPPAGVVTGGGIPMPNTPIAPAPAASLHSTATQVRTQ
ncbi:MAG: hypothetical protein V4476_09645 [Pseudomonadota bacterium]